MKISELYEDIKGDISDRKVWRERTEGLGKYRLGERKAKKSFPYAGAPNFLEPIIDDNVRQVTAAENTILWSTRYIADFLPLDVPSSALRLEAASAFDTMLRTCLGVRAKLECLLDKKNEIGMGIAKLVYNTTAVRGQVLPDFVSVDPFDVIVPTCTRNIREAERICHIIRYTPRQLKKWCAARGVPEAKAEAVIEKCKQGGYGKTTNGQRYGTQSSESNGSDPSRIKNETAPYSMEIIEVWEVYHFDEEGHRYLCIFCPCAANDGEELLTVEWTRDGEDRRWPFVQFRFENRTDLFHDVRGIADLLEDNQKSATQHLNSKGVQLDYFSAPMFRGSKHAAGTFRFRPGGVLPSGIEPVMLPKVDPIFDYSADLERASAARRVGSIQSSLSSTQRGKDAKTATEVSTAAMQNTMLSSDAVQRFMEPMAELFNMMWSELRFLRPEFPVISASGEFSGMAAPSIYDGNFVIVPSASSKNSNPDFQLQQLMGMGPFFLQNPFVDMAAFTEYIVQLLDPRLVDRVVVKTGAGSQIQQQIQMLAQQVQAQGQYLSTIAQEDMGGGDGQRGGGMGSGGAGVAGGGGATGMQGPQRAPGVGGHQGMPGMA